MIERRTPRGTKRTLCAKSTAPGKPVARLRDAGVLLAVAITCALLGVACLGRSPAVEHYLLGAAGPSSLMSSAPVAASDADSSELAILVGPVSLPAYLERDQIARLGAGGRVRLEEFGRWLGGFEENFLRATSLGLAREIGSVKVVSFPSSAPFPLDYRIRLHVDDLVHVEAGSVLRVRIRWALIDESDASPTQLFLLETEVPVQDASNQGLVEAHERVLSELVSSIARELR